MRLDAGLFRLWAEELEEGDHGRSLPEWAAILRAADPGEYRARPAPTPEVAVSRETIIQIYAARVAAGLSVFHPEDSWQPGVGDLSRLGVEAVRGRNGSVAEGEVVRG